MDAGADLQALANDGRGPLHFAAGAAQRNVVAFLCKMYTEKSWAVDGKDETGRTALHHATRSGNSESVCYLLQCGANPNAKDNEGLASLHVAAEYQMDTTRLRKQRKHNAKIPYSTSMSSFEKKSPPSRGTDWKPSPVICQEEEARMIQDVVRLLLSAGADPFICDKAGQTAYDVAVYLDFEEVACVLAPLRQETDLHLDQRSITRKQSHEGWVQHINIESADAYTLLQTAIGLRNEDMLDSLLKAGVDCAILGPEGLTPVHTIAHWGLVSMTKVVTS